MVAENATVADAAMEVLAAGGSAADAAVVGLLTAGVAQPVSSGIGGGGFALVWDASAKRVTVLDFREMAPHGLRESDYAERPPVETRRGVMVGVPGEVAGLTELHQRWGKLPWAELVRRAADRAEQGFVVSHHMARALRWNRAWLLAAPGYEAVFAPLGKLLAAQAVARNPALASTLRRIATEGRAGFYQGAIAQDVVTTARRAGSRFTQQDLDAYRVVERAPLHTRWETTDIYTMPPPSAGGLMVLQTLHMHSRAELVQLGYRTGAYTHVLAETFRGAIADRIREIGDPAFVKMDVEGLVARARMRTRREQIAPGRTRQADAFPLREAGTSHFAAMDGAGNVVCVTSTVNNMFGAKLVSRGGFVLNDELDDFSTRRLEDRFRARSRPNRPRGGARPVSSMTPTLAVRDGAVVLAVGGSGGTRIATGVTQTLLARLAFGRSAEQAVTDPRFHTPPGGGVWVEDAESSPWVVDLRKRGELVRQRPNYSSVGMITVDRRNGSQRIEAAGDPRKGGTGRIR